MIEQTGSAFRDVQLRYLFSKRDLEKKLDKVSEPCVWLMNSSTGTQDLLPNVRDEVHELWRYAVGEFIKLGKFTFQSFSGLHAAVSMFIASFPVVVNALTYRESTHLQLLQRSTVVQEVLRIQRATVCTVSSSFKYHFAHDEPCSWPILYAPFIMTCRQP